MSNINDLWFKGYKKEVEVLEDKICFNALEKVKFEDMFSWKEKTSEQILLSQKICDLYTKFAMDLIDLVPFSSQRDDALKTLFVSKHYSLDSV